MALSVKVPSLIEVYSWNHQVFLLPLRLTISNSFRFFLEEVFYKMTISSVIPLLVIHLSPYRE